MGHGFLEGRKVSDESCGHVAMHTLEISIKACGQDSVFTCIVSREAVERFRTSRDSLNSETNASHRSLIKGGRQQRKDGPMQVNGRQAGAMAGGRSPIRAGPFFRCVRRRGKPVSCFETRFLSPCRAKGQFDAAHSLCLAV